MDKITITLVIVLVAVLALSCAFAVYNSTENADETVLNVSSEGPWELSKVTDEIKTKEYYEGYDNETLSWMESLGNKYVWFSDDEIVIMDWWDSNEIPSVSVCDGYAQEIFSCNVMENRSLGNMNNSKEVLLVKNVEYIGEEIHGNGLA